MAVVSPKGGRKGSGTISEGVLPTSANVIAEMVPDPFGCNPGIENPSGRTGVSGYTVPGSRWTEDAFPPEIRRWTLP